MAIDQQELAKHVKLDKQRASELSSAALARLGETMPMVAEDMTGSPAEAKVFQQYKRGERLALNAVWRDLFFARVDVRRTSRLERDSLVAMLVTKARVSPGTDGEDWEVLSWTSPITKDLLDRPIGEEFTFQATPRHSQVHFRIDTSAKYEAVLPIKNAKYVLHSGKAFLESEAQLTAELRELPTKPKRKRYDAQETFGLGEIIVLADSPQRAAMHLPFEAHVLIQGPPGSGKTSIGIMRLPCLFDRQFEELDVTRERPFHTYESMRILVLNDEMVDYLDSLTRSLAIEGVQVLTIRDFLRRICREAGTLRGRETLKTGPAARLKAHPAAIPAYWAGFKAHVAAVLEERQAEWTERFVAIGKPGEIVLDELQQWAEGLRDARLDGGSLPTYVNLAARTSDAVVRALARGIETHRDPRAEEAQRQAAFATLRESLRKAWTTLLHWVGVHRAMFTTPEYSALLETCRQGGMAAGDVTDGDRAWQEQFEKGEPQFNEYDATLAAWLGAHVGLAPATGRDPVVGGKADRLTHILIDEAQDIWPAHVLTIQKLLVDGGTMTLVGDLRQRLKDTSGFLRWEELGARDLRPAVFGVNYRQSYEIGRFVHRLHERLFDEAPVWRASKERRGPSPRVCQAGPRELLAATAAEVRHWREEVPRATVGVLYDGHWSRDRLRRFGDHLESELQDTLTPVYLVSRSGGETYLRRTDCVVFAPIIATKGLEFDAVVVVDRARAWKNALDQIPDRRKNGMYVSVSQACHMLSLVMRAVPDCLDEMARDRLCEAVAPP